MDNELFFDGKKYISSKRAGEFFGYAGDYISQLCRAHKIEGRRIGRTWFVSEESIKSYVDLKNVPRSKFNEIDKKNHTLEEHKQDSWEKLLFAEDEIGGDKKNNWPIKLIVTSPKSETVIDNVIEKSIPGSTETLKVKSFFPALKAEKKDGFSTKEQTQKSMIVPKFGQNLIQKEIYMGEKKVSTAGSASYNKYKIAIFFASTITGIILLLSFVSLREHVLTYSQVQGAY